MPYIEDYSAHNPGNFPTDEYVVRKFDYNFNTWMQLGYPIGPQMSLNSSPAALLFKTAHNRFAFYTSGIPFTTTRSTIQGWDGSSWASINGSGSGWPVPGQYVISGLAPAISANNKVFVAFTYANRPYVWGYHLSPPALPQVPVHLLSYCQGDAATPLQATGKKLKWYTSYNGVGTIIAPTPQTSVPGMYKWYVSQSSPFYESPKDSITVTIHPKPNPTISFNGTHLYVNGNYAAWQWYHQGKLISGANSDTLTPTQQTGNYTVAVTDSNGCSGLSDPFPTHISTINIKDRLKIYPNPNRGRELIIEAYQLKPGNYTLDLFNALGKRIWQKTYSLHNKKENISLDFEKPLTDGMYYLKLYNTHMQLNTSVLIHNQ